MRYGSAVGVNIMTDPSILTALVSATAIGAAAYTATIRFGLAFALPFSLCISAVVPLIILH